MFWVLCLCGLTPLASGAVLISKESALKRILPQAETTDHQTISLTTAQIADLEQKANIERSDEFGSLYNVYVGKNNGQIVGYAIEDMVHGKWGPIHYIAGITPDGKISDVVVLEYKEIRGRPVAKKKFLRQFYGKTIQDPLKLRKDIDGITGATISSRGMTEGVRKLLHIFEEFLKS